MLVNNIQSYRSNYEIPMTSTGTAKNHTQDYSNQTKKLNEPSFTGFLSARTKPIIKNVVEEYITNIVQYANENSRPLNNEEILKIKDAKDLGNSVINKLESFASQLHKYTAFDLYYKDISHENKSLLGLFTYTLTKRYPMLALRNVKHNQFLPIEHTRGFSEPMVCDKLKDKFLYVNTQNYSFNSLNSLSDLRVLEDIATQLTKPNIAKDVNKYMFLECFNSLKYKANTESTIIGRLKNAYNSSRANKLAKAYKIPDENGITWGEKLKEYQTKT